MAAGGDPLEEALAAAVGGDEAAFCTVYRTVQPRLLRYLRVRAGEWAEDLAAETWLEVVRRLERFDGGPAAFRAWVFTIARAEYVDRVRYEGRRPATPTEDLAAVARPDPQDVAALVVEAAATLPPST